jgi:hypothetical protein
MGGPFVHAGLSGGLSAFNLAGGLSSCSSCGPGQGMHVVVVDPLRVWDAVGFWVAHEGFGEAVRA